MRTIKIILLYLFFGLSLLVRGQQIGNYVSNGSFEYLRPNAVWPSTFAFPPVFFGWSGIDTNQNGFFPHHSYFGNSPSNSTWGCDIQSARTGSGFVMNTVYIENSASRGYFRNKLKAPLINGVPYCVKYFVNVRKCQPTGIDAFGAFFGDNLLDTISNPYQAQISLVPQIENPLGNFVTDSVGWTLISGTFTAVGNERYIVLGNFKASQNTGTIALTNPVNSSQWCDVNIDDVSVIEINLPAYAGPDQLIYSGDSAFIGRQPDFATDTGCIWYKLPNMTMSLDTISGIWVKPTTTSTYVVRQELDCSPIKWDTVVVTISTNFVGFDKLQNLSDNINLFPNPTLGNLSISDFSSSDISSFSISNCLGQNVLNGDIIQKNNLIIIETSELESGLYQIHLKTQYGIVTKKFVKTN